MLDEYFFYINKRRIPGSPDDEFRSGRDDAERPAPTAMMKFRTVEETVRAMQHRLFTREACLTRWNQNAEEFVLSHFGTGKFAPPTGFVADVVAEVEDWLGKNPNFRRTDGQWIWGVLD